MSDDPATGSVGIFWMVADGDMSKLVSETTSLAAAEPFGEFLTHPNGHYKTWEAWRVLGPGELLQRKLPAAIAWNEYEDFPRGRVVFHVSSGRFTVYADCTLFTGAVRRQLAGAFGFEWQRATLGSDPHYRTGSLKWPSGEHS